MIESYSYHLVKALLTLLFVIVVMGGGLYLLRGFMNKKGLLKKGAKIPVKVLSTSYLGQKKNITLVDVAGEVLVLGVTPSSINLLTKVEDLDSLERLREEGGETQKFSSILSGKIASAVEAESGSSDSTPKASAANSLN